MARNYDSVAFSLEDDDDTGRKMVWGLINRVTPFLRLGCCAVFAKDYDNDGNDDATPSLCSLPRS